MEPVRDIGARRELFVDEIEKVVTWTESLTCLPLPVNRYKCDFS